MTGDCRVFKFFPAQCGQMTFDAFQCEIMVVKFVWRSVHGKHLRDFHSENIVFKFLQRRVDGTLGTRRGFLRSEAVIVAKGKTSVRHDLDRGFTAHNRNYENVWHPG